MGSFPEQTVAACAYLGKLLGLMAIHLILLAANIVRPDLEGSIEVHSDCVGALEKSRTSQATGFQLAIDIQTSSRM